MKKLLRMKIHWQILLAMIMGIIFGIIFQFIYDGSPTGIIYSIIIALGEIFIRLLKMVIVPLILSSIVSGVSSVGEGKSIGRLGLKTFLYFFVSSILAILVGLLLANAIRPGVGADIPVGHDFKPGDMVKPQSAGEILLGMIPLNPVAAASEGHMLGLIFFAIFLGVAITKIKQPSQDFLKKLFNSFFEVMMKITEYIIKLAPLGVLGLITKTVSTAGVGLFKTVSLYIITILGGFFIHLFVILPLIFYLTTRINPLYHFKAMISAMVTAFSTCSSNATLPVTMSNVEKKAGVSNTISSFVLPMGATVNMNGTALYECAGVIFISQVLGIELGLTQQFVIALTALLAAIGAAGIPAAGVVVIFIVTQAVGFRDTDIAAIIGVMLAVDRPIDMFRTTINIFSDSIGAVIVAKSEGETDLYKEIKDRPWSKRKAAAGNRPGQSS